MPATDRTSSMVSEATEDEWQEEPDSDLVEFPCQTMPTRRHGAAIAACVMAFAGAVILVMWLTRGFSGVPTLDPMVVPLGLGLIAVMLVVVLLLHDCDIVSTVLRDRATAPIREILEQLRKPLGRQASVRVRELSNQLVQLGRVGVTIRLCPREAADPVNPIRIPFEPIPLDESASSFRSLEQGLFAATGPDQRAGVAESLPEDEPLSALKRNVALGGGWPQVIVLTVGILGGVAQWWYLGRLSVVGVVFALNLGLIAFGVGRGAWRVNKQWLLVPGALIVRTSTATRRGWRLSMFSRATSILATYQATRRTFVLRVTDSAGSQSITITPREARLALCAWLSPLPPPELERLADLN